MHSCESCQNLLLESLYGLLDDADQQPLQAHLVGCAACQAALAQVQKQQHLFAAAAKLEFPAVRFVEPAKEPAPAPRLPLPKPAAVRPWRRWASAAALWLTAVGFTQWVLSASVMLILFAIAGSIAWFGSDYACAQDAVVQHKVEVALLADQEKAAAAGRAELDRKLPETFAAIHSDFREKQLRVVVTGPATVQPGARNVYHVAATDLNYAPTDATVSAQLMNGDKKVGAPIAGTATAQPGNYVVNLPADLPVKLGSVLDVRVSADRPNGARADVREELCLAAAPVYVANLTTDKPMYQPGEEVYFHALTLDRATLKPAQEELRYHFYLTTPHGEKKDVLSGGNGIVLADTLDNFQYVNGPDQKPLRGVSAGKYQLDREAEGGEYTLTLLEERNRFPAQERKFIVNRYQKPQLNKELNFGKKSYGVGEEVTARCKATDTRNLPVKNQAVAATVLIDGKNYDANGRETKVDLHARTDAEGIVNVRFKLPAEIDRGLASLTVKFQDGANVESIVRPIPLVLKKLNVEFFPEGGELVAGLQNRVYFQVRTPLDKPADLKGRLLEDGTPTAVQLETLNDAKEPGVNQGMGVFTFTPKAGHAYEVQAEAPAGVTQRFALPELKKDGVVLTIDESVVRADKPTIAVKVYSTKPRALVVGAYCRGLLLDTVRLEKGQTEATLQPGTPAGGVCRVTVFEELEGQGNGRREVQPIAERLIYRAPVENVTLALHPDQSSYQPGQKVKMTVEAVNEKDEPAAAVLLLRVVDKRVVTLADEKTARSMPTHFLLTTEVRRAEDLEYADFLLGPQEKAHQALDLLLGTQGWRRFAEQDPAKFRKLHNDSAEAERLVCLFGGSEPQTTDFVDQEIQKATDHYQAEVQRLADTQTHAKDQRQSASADVGYLAAVAKVAQYRAYFDDVNRWLFPGLGVLLAGIVVGSVVLGLVRKARRALPYFAAAALSAVVLAVGLEVYVSHQANEPFASGKLAEDGQQVAVVPPASGAGAGAEGNKWDEAAEQRPFDVREKKGDKKEVEKRALEGDAKDRPKDDRKDKDPTNLAKNIAPAPMPAPGPKGAFPPGAPLAAPGGPPPLAAGKPADGNLDKPDVKLAREVAPDANFHVIPNNRRLYDEDQFRADAALRKTVGEAKKKKADAPRGDLAEVERARQFGAPGGGPAGPPGIGGGGGGGGFQGGSGGGLPINGNAFGRANNAKDEQLALPPLLPVVVREYAHKLNPPDNAGVRADFAETLYWHPVLVLPNGKREVSFDLGDSATTYQVTAFAHTLDGRLGSATQTFDARLPFTLEPKVPIEVTSGDKIDVPLSIANNGTAKEKVRVRIESKEGLALLRGDADAEFDVPAGAPVRKVYRFQPTLKEGQASLTFAGNAGVFADRTKNGFTVVPEGFPVVGSRSDLLEGSATQTLPLPNSWVADTLKVQVDVYPSTLADLQKGLDSLLREPHGCFEQTSTSNYPNLLILDYLKESDQTKPEVERRARDLLARGYQQLTSFECTNEGKKAKEGYEWFGGTAPAHEALTAYGLLQFRDMARVQDVDPQMVERTRQYLLSRRDGKGGFERNPRALDSFGRAPDEITNAYIIWALTEGGKDDDVTKELNVLNEQAQKSKDPYFLALVANGLLNRDGRADAVRLMKKVAEIQKEDGHLDAERTSITGSGGRDLQIETTALAVLGWLKANDPGEFNAPVQKAVKWIGQQRGGYGGFGSTQSTILALKALIAYTRANKRTPQPGELKLFVGDREVSKRAFAAGATEALTLAIPDAEKVLKPGDNKVRVEITGKNAFPYTLSWTYSTLQPVSAENCPVYLTTKLAQTEVKEGDSVRLTVQVENKSGKGQGMAVAIVGLPGGLTVPEDLKQLKEYTAKPVNGDRPLVSAFEIRGRELVLYWRDLAPDQKIEVPVDLIGRVPGEYSGPASRAYLYYNADLKHWVAPLKLAIAAKE